MKFEITLEDLQNIDSKIFVVLNVDKLKEITQRVKNRHNTIAQFSEIIGCSESFLAQILRRERKPRLILFEKIKEVFFRLCLMMKVQLKLNQEK